METNNNCKECEEVKKRLDKEMAELLKDFSHDKDNLIKILEETQNKYGYIPQYTQYIIADYLNMPASEVYGVISFYSRFSTKPKGKYNVSVCLGTACFVKGSKDLLERAKTHLGIDEGETTPDGKFSLDTLRCVGACGLAPVFIINEEVYGKATVKKMDEILNEYEKNNP